MAWNMFKFCTTLQGLGLIIILLVLRVVGVTYYAVVLTKFGPALYSGGIGSVSSVAVLILFHCLVSFKVDLLIPFFFVLKILIFYFLFFIFFFGHLDFEFDLWFV